MVTPPANPIRKQTKALPPLEAYLKHLLIVRLKPESDIISFVSKQLQRLPWSDPQMDCGSLVCKYMLKACRKGRYMATKAVADVAATLRRARPEISSRLIDAALEELQWFMEHPNFRDQQRILVIARLLGELHNAALVPTSLIFDQLHHFIDFGHQIPEALREVSEKQHQQEENSGSGDMDKLTAGSESDISTTPTTTTSEIKAKSLLSQPLDITQAIPEDEELEETDEPTSNPSTSLTTTASAVPANPAASVVAVSKYSQFDPRVPSSIDAPNSVSRIKLVCALLESMGPNIVANNNLPKLHYFLASFQRYLFTKSTLPTEVEFSILDLFDFLDSFWKGAEKKEGRSNKNNNTNIFSGNNSGSGNGGFVRYTNWIDAHNATIAAEESEAMAEARAKARLLAVGGSAEDAASTMEDDKDDLESSDGIVLLSEEEDDDVDDLSINSESVKEMMMESEDSDADVGSVDDNDNDDTDSEDMNMSEEESDSGTEIQSGDSDDETEDSDDDMYMDDEEEEIDEATAQEMYMRQLEEEAFERELRKITMEAIEKGRVAARTGNAGKIADNMVHASHFVVKKNTNNTNTDSSNAAGGTSTSSGDDPNLLKTALGGGEGVNFKLLKRGHKGRVEAKHFIVPSETNLARQATKQDDEAAREHEALKARVLQYEVESAEQQYSGNVYMDQTKLQVIRNRPLSMEDIDRNFGNSSSDYSYPSSSSRWPNSSSDRQRSSHHHHGHSGGRGGGRGRGGRSLRFY